MVSLITHSLKRWLRATVKGTSSSGKAVIWLTIKTTRFRWEAELMQQMLIAHDISVRLIDLGIESYMGQGSSAALQVHVEDEQAALLWLSTLNGDAEALK